CREGGSAEQPVKPARSRWAGLNRFEGGWSMKRNDDVVSASEIAAWAWCPESWRLSALGAEPENRAALKRGEKFHARTAAFESRSRSAISLGAWLVAVALVSLVVFWLVGG